MTLFAPIEPILYGYPNTQATLQGSSVPFRDPSSPMFGAPCGVCMFPLPFRLLLEDGVWFAARLCGEPVAIRVTHQIQPSYDRRTALQTLDRLELSNDRRGIVSYSEVEVQFPYSLVLSEQVRTILGFSSVTQPSIITTEWLDSLDDSIEMAAIFVVNRLLGAYRLLTGQHFVRPVNRGEIFHMHRGWGG